MTQEGLYPVAPILLVDDEETWLSSLSFILEYSGGITNHITCSDSRQVLDILEKREISLILLDLTMPHFSGEELLEKIAAAYPEVPVVILSGLNQLETAVRCMKKGAVDYFVKTSERERLLAGIKRLLELQDLQRQNRRLIEGFLGSALANEEAFSGIVTQDGKMRVLFRYVEALADSREPVLIRGESGVGKELFSKAVHMVSRPEGPWVVVNVAGLDDNIFSDTLFGHVRGAFTGADKDRPGMIERANGGTLFLDEIGDLSPQSQVKLLRFLQDGEFLPLGSDHVKKADVRVVLATNQDLEQKQSAGIFRKDLYFRLSSHQIRIPPLRERKGDLPLLIDYFLSEAAELQKKKKPTPPDELYLLLSTYSFPGNVRELRSLIHDAVSRHQRGKLSMGSFKEAISGKSELIPSSDVIASDQHPSIFSSIHKLPTLSESAELLVEEALRRATGNQTLAAGMLGITRQALSKRLKKNG